MANGLIMENQRFEELLIRELTGDLTPAEHQELMALTQANPARQREYDIFKDYWTKKEPVYTDAHSAFEKIKGNIRIIETDAGLHSEFSTDPHSQPGPKMLPAAFRRFWLSWQGAAAILILSLGIGSGLYFYAIRPATPSISWQEKYTARKTRSRLILSDGTSIMLNADSRLKYPATFDGRTREVYLTGEAFFDVQKDPAHPFIIHTEKMNIRVLGTSFNVRSYPEDISMETTLLQGAIEVTFPDRPSDRIILKPKDKLVIGNPAPARIPVALANTKTANTSPAAKYTLTALTYYRKQDKDTTVVETSWMDNKLAFQHEEFQTLAHRMERWYGVTIIFDDQSLAELRLTGLFQKESITEALHALQLTERFQYTMEGTVIHIH